MSWTENLYTHAIFDLSLFMRFSGSTAGHPDGSVPAVYPEHIWGDPLPADDLDGRDRRRPRLLHNRLHVLLHST